MEGSIHSFQSMGGADGPGLRSVVFAQGCPLRCVYCHNPDTQEFTGANTTVDALLAKIYRYRCYFQNGGGVTLSGGEPLCQPAFATSLFKALQLAGIHTCLDTAGVGSLPDARAVLEHTDLVLCDIKFIADEDYHRYTGASMVQVFGFLDLCKTLKKPVWVRHVVVPNLTDSDQSILRLKEICSVYENIEKIELLPFKNICIGKYEQLGRPFPMGDTASMNLDRLQELKALL